MRTSSFSDNDYKNDDINNDENDNNIDIKTIKITITTMI